MSRRNLALHDLAIGTAVVYDWSYARADPPGVDTPRVGLVPHPMRVRWPEPSPDTLKAMADRGRGAGLARIAHSAATLACALLIYYGLPLRAEHLSDVAQLIVFALGVVGLLWLIVRQIRRYVAGPPATSGRLFGVLTVLYAVTVFFALCYYLIERNTPGQFAGLSSRTDALYYTVVTLGTVGFGDVHAVGQAARAVTMVQITFDLVVIGVLVAVASAQFADRAGRQRDEITRPG